MSDSDLFSKIGFLQGTEYKVKGQSYVSNKRLNEMRNTPESRNLELCNLFSQSGLKTIIGCVQPAPRLLSCKTVVNRPR